MRVCSVRLVQRFFTGPKSHCPNPQHVKLTNKVIGIFTHTYCKVTPHLTHWIQYKNQLRLPQELGASEIPSSAWHLLSETDVRTPIPTGNRTKNLNGQRPEHTWFGLSWAGDLFLPPFILANSVTRLLQPTPLLYSSDHHPRIARPVLL